MNHPEPLMLVILLIWLWSSLVFLPSSSVTQFYWPFEVCSLHAPILNVGFSQGCILDHWEDSCHSLRLNFFSCYLNITCFSVCILKMLVACFPRFPGQQTMVTYTRLCRSWFKLEAVLDVPTYPFGYIFHPFPLGSMCPRSWPLDTTSPGIPLPAAFPLCLANDRHWQIRGPKESEAEVSPCFFLARIQFGNGCIPLGKATASLLWY